MNIEIITAIGLICCGIGGISLVFQIAIIRKNLKKEIDTKDNEIKFFTEVVRGHSESLIKLSGFDVKTIKIIEDMSIENENLIGILRKLNDKLDTISNRLMIEPDEIEETNNDINNHNFKSKEEVKKGKSL